MPSAPFSVRALYEYKAEMDDDLPFSPGQRLSVDEVLDEDWYHGHYVDTRTDKRLEGIFPVNYVEVELPPSRPQRRAPPSVPNLNKFSETMKSDKPKAFYSVPIEPVLSNKEEMIHSVPRFTPQVLEARKGSFSPRLEAENNGWSDDEQEDSEEEAKEIKLGAPSAHAELSGQVAKEAAGKEQLPSASRLVNTQDEASEGSNIEAKIESKKLYSVKTEKVLEAAAQSACQKSIPTDSASKMSKGALETTSTNSTTSAVPAVQPFTSEKADTVLKRSHLASEAAEDSESEPVPTTTNDMHNSKHVNSHSSTQELEFTNDNTGLMSSKSIETEADEKINTISHPQRSFRVGPLDVDDWSESEQSADSHKPSSIMDNSEEPDFKTRLARFNQGAAIDDSELNLRRLERHATFGKTLNISNSTEENHHAREYAEEYKPSVSLKERIAMLQRSQQEEAASAEANAAAEERRKARRAKLAEEAEANRKARLETETLEKEREFKERQEIESKKEAERKVREQEQLARREKAASAAPSYVPAHPHLNVADFHPADLENKVPALSLDDNSRPIPVFPQPTIPHSAKHEAQNLPSAPETSSQPEKSLNSEPDETSREIFEEEDNEEDNAEARRIALRERMARLANSTCGVNLGMIMSGGRAQTDTRMPKRERRISRSEYEAMSAAEIEAAEARREAEESAPVNIFGRGPPPPNATATMGNIVPSKAEPEEPESEDQGKADFADPAAPYLPTNGEDDSHLGERVAEPQIPQASHSHADIRSPDSGELHDIIEQNSSSSPNKKSQHVHSIDKTEKGFASLQGDDIDFEFDEEPKFDTKDISKDTKAMHSSVLSSCFQSSSAVTASAHPRESQITQLSLSMMPSSAVPTRPSHAPTSSETMQTPPPPPPPHAHVAPAPGGPHTAAPSAPHAAHHQPTPTRSLPIAPASAPPPPAPGARPPPSVPSTQTRAPPPPPPVFAYPAPPVAAPVHPTVSPAALASAFAPHAPAPSAPTATAPPPPLPPPSHTTAPLGNAPQLPNSPPRRPASISRAPTFGSSAPPPPVARPVDGEHAPIQSNISRSSQRSQELARSESAAKWHGKESSWLTSGHGVPPGIVGAGDAFEVKNTTNQRRVLVLHPDWTHTIYMFSTANGEQLSKLECAAPQMDLHQLKDVSTRLGAIIVAAAQNDMHNLDHSASSVARLLESNGALVAGKSFGMEIYTNIGNASVQQHDEIRPGDICVCEDASFQGQRGPLQKYNKTYRDSVFVVGEWDGTKRKLHFVDSKKETARLGDLRMGVVRIFRALDSKFFIA